MKPIWDFLERAMSVSPALAHGDVHGAARDVAIAKAAVSAQPRPKGPRIRWGCRLTMQEIMQGD
jgi:hypothetical protein